MGVEEGEGGRWLSMQGAGGDVLMEVLALVRLGCLEVRLGWLEEQPGLCWAEELGLNEAFSHGVALAILSTLCLDGEPLSLGIEASDHGAAFVSLCWDAEPPGLRIDPVELVSLNSVGKAG